MLLLDLGIDMKLIIAGSRTIPKEKALWEFLKRTTPHGDFGLWLQFKGNDIKELVTGCCHNGADQIPFMLEKWWDNSGYSLGFDITSFPADWGSRGLAAGPIRNKEMAEYADALLLIWDGESKGSASMKNEMELQKKPIYEIIIK